MDNIKDDNYYLEKVIENIDAIIRYVGSKTYEEFIEDEILVNASLFRLIQMAENIERL